ncbi:hypothetical protein MNBD_PLANCTO03-1881 [hydrothermal vent metagenome]|uniref:Uncharacterized protein n=1 Tax=hydrothermal vent metagenome TaxID=652676 RepID=A0A3B1DTA5_9ZZZZ
MQSRVIGSLIALALLVAGIAFNNIRKGDQGLDMHEEMLALIEHLPDYTTHGSLYSTWFDQNHETAFNNNYTIEYSGRRMRNSQTTFDGDSYLTDLFDAMATQAATEGYKEQAQNLRTLREQLSWEYEEDE